VFPECLLVRRDTDGNLAAGGGLTVLRGAVGVLERRVERLSDSLDALRVEAVDWVVRTTVDGREPGLCEARRIEHRAPRRIVVAALDAVVEGDLDNPTQN
jgi:hypothetical protein